jgi:hypothetical protein
VLEQFSDLLIVTTSPLLFTIKRSENCSSTSSHKVTLQRQGRVGKKQPNCDATSVRQDTVTTSPLLFTVSCRTDVASQFGCFLHALRSLYLWLMLPWQQQQQELFKFAPDGGGGAAAAAACEAALGQNTP